MNPNQICPYCGNVITDVHEDHIFSEFLGGRGTIASCASCNNGFGHDFEGRISNALLSLKALLTAAGIPLRWARDFRWREACEFQQTLCDLKVTDSKITLIRSRPEIVRDEAGKPKTVFARTPKEGRRIADDLMRKGKIKHADLKVEYSPANFSNTRFFVDAGVDLGRLCLKMCIAAATLLPDFNNADVAVATAAVHRDHCELALVKRDGRTHEFIDTARPPLAHVIFVERSRNQTYGLVQFFGALQFYCLLGRGSDAQDAGLLAVLDGIAGSEKFVEVQPVRVPELPTLVPGSYQRSMDNQWSAKLTDQIQRVSGTGVTLSLELSRSPRVVLFESGTAQFWPFGRRP